MSGPSPFIEARISISLLPGNAVLAASAGIHALLGYSPDELRSGRVALTERFHADDIDIAAVVFAATPLPAVGTHNVRLRQANGRIRCVRLDYEKTLTADAPVLALHLQDARSLANSQADPTMMANFRAMMENTDDFIFFKDRNHVFTGASQTLVSLTAPIAHWSELLGKTDYDVFPEAYADTYYALEKQVFAGAQIAHEIQKTLSKDGKEGWVDNRKYPVRNDAGEIIGLFGIARDITESKRVEAELHRTQQFSKLVIEKLPGIFYLYTYPENRLVLWNKQHELLLGYDESEMAGRLITDWHYPEARTAVLDAIDFVMKHGQHSIEAPLLAKDGHPVHFALTGVRFDTTDKTYYLGLGTDISQRKLLEEEIRLLAFHDPLTKLPNRRLLNDRMSQAMAASKRSGLYGALMFLDLDNFKPLNDAHGHEVGDLLLIEVADRLKACVREMDTVARFGGDEFIIMIRELDSDKVRSTAQARVIAEKIRLAMARSYVLSFADNGEKTVRHHCTASIGVVLFANHEASQSDILKWADTAMYLAKEAGRNTVHIATDIPQRDGIEAGMPRGTLQLTWHPSYESGHALIDEQHRSLFTQTNAVLAAIFAGEAKPVVEALLDQLIDTMTTHFADEESVLAEIAFSDAAEHARGHRQLAAGAQDLATRFHAGNLPAGEFLQYLAYDLVARHILVADRAFFAALTNLPRAQ